MFRRFVGLVCIISGLLMFAFFTISIAIILLFELWFAPILLLICTIAVFYKGKMYLSDNTHYRRTELKKVFDLRYIANRIKIRNQLLLMVVLSFVVYIGVHLFLWWPERFDRLFSSHFYFFIGSIAFMSIAPILFSMLFSDIYEFFNRRKPESQPYMMWVIWIITANMTSWGQLAIAFGG